MVRKKYTTTKTVKGRVYQYFRKDGVYTPLPDDPNSEEYDREYWTLMRGKRARSSRHTFDKLIISYKQSPRFLDLKPRTQANYRVYLDYISDRAGSHDVTRFQRQNAIEVLQANVHRPRAANYILQVMSVLFEHSIDLGWRSDNPAKGVRKLSSGEGYKPWPEWAIAAFRKHATPEALLLFELALGTGQRAGDLLRMKWSDFDGTGISLKQGKRGAELWVPCTDALLSVLKTAPRNGVCILGDRNGRPLTYSGIRLRIVRIGKLAGTTAYSLHGLRYNAAGYLAEIGATDAQIAAITGHKARQMVVKYSSGARQKRLATEVINLRERNKNKT